MASSIVKLNPDLVHWEGALIKSATRTHDLWVNGLDVGAVSSESKIKFVNQVESVVKNKVSSYNISIISALITNEMVLTDSHFLNFDGKSQQIGSIDISSIKELVLSSKKVQLQDTKNTDLDLVTFLKNIEMKVYERELIFLVTSVFDDLIVKYNLEKKVDTNFLNQIYATSNKPLDLVKYVFFTMGQHELLKKDRLFKVLFGYLADQNLDDLYLYLKSVD